MKKNSSLHSMLASYSALATVIIGGIKTADGQIIYNDRVPNDTINLVESYFLDLNNDGITDFRFNLKYQNGNTAIDVARVVGLDYGNSMSWFEENPFKVYGYYFAPALYSDSPVGGSDFFKSLVLLGTHADNNYYGYWPGTTDRFLGLKLVVDSKAYYGWARLSLNQAANQLIVSDYAVDTIANEPIKTGDKCGNYALYANTIINPPDPVTLCAGENVDLVTNTGAGLLYQWYLNDNLIAGAEDSAYTANAAGKYSVIVSTTYGCVDTATAVQVFILALPGVPVITQDANTLTSTAATSYQWFSNIVLIPGATNQTYNPTQGGNFTVEITDANGCKSISNSFAFIFTAIPAINALGMDVFVANNIVTVQLNDNKFLGGHLKISNALGDEVFDSTVNSQNIIIDLHQMPGGFYLLTIDKSGKSESRKIVIQ